MNGADRQRTKTGEVIVSVCRYYLVNGHLSHNKGSGENALTENTAIKTGVSNVCTYMCSQNSLYESYADASVINLTTLFDLQQTCSHSTNNTHLGETHEVRISFHILLKSRIIIFD